MRVWLLVFVALILFPGCAKPDHTKDLFIPGLTLPPGSTAVGCWYSDWSGNWFNGKKTNTEVHTHLQEAGIVRLLDFDFDCPADPDTVIKHFATQLAAAGLEEVEPGQAEDGTDCMRRWFSDEYGVNLIPICQAPYPIQKTNPVNGQQYSADYLVEIFEFDPNAEITEQTE